MGENRHRALGLNDKQVLEMYETMLFKKNR